MATYKTQFKPLRTTCNTECQNKSCAFTQQKHSFNTIKVPLLMTKSGTLKMVYITYLIIKTISSAQKSPKSGHRKIFLFPQSVAVFCQNFSQTENHENLSCRMDFGVLLH